VILSKTFAPLDCWKSDAQIAPEIASTVLLPCCSAVFLLWMQRHRVILPLIARRAACDGMAFNLLYIRP
jgi:hypothetical protein